MGSPGSGAVDYAVGSIVWVRRRNGSWWPGKILGSDELSSSHLTSPRSGTPVKLLGREDASVLNIEERWKLSNVSNNKDWYNLEKSKRVKPFRCGEFDDCIERAESSQGMPIKKREKYARREDAILHALELEKELLNKQGKLNLYFDQTIIGSPGATAKKGIISSDHIGTGDINDGHSESLQFSKIIDVNYDNEIDPCLKANEGAQRSGEDDHSEARPRMRGLQDFGLRITSSKRKVLSSSVVSNGFEMLATDTSVLAPPVGVCNIGNDSGDANGMQQIDLAKRSKCMYLPADSSDSLECRESSLGQVEVSTPHLGSGVMPSRPDSLVEENASGSSENDSSGSETDSDSSRSDQDMDNDMAALSEKEPNTFEKTDTQEHGNVSSEEHDDSVHSGDMSHLYHHDPVSTNEAVSKWQLKGKRNVRNFSKKLGGVDEPSSHLWVHGQTTFSNRNDYFDDSIEGVDALEEEYYLTSKMVSKDQYFVRNYMHDWEGQPALKGYWDVKNPLYGLHHHFGGMPRTILIDVDVKVHASYQKEPVPIVSLMSKLNGQAIIGHPIQIETLEDGFSETILSDSLGNALSENDGNTAFQPSWRTARRTANVRIPRPHLPTVLDGEEAGYDSPFGDQERKSRFKRVKTGVYRQKAGQGREQPHIPRGPSNDRRLPKKMAKKVSLSSIQKTRTLSSIAVEQNFSNMPIHDSVTCQINGSIKPESSGPPTVACIPVKLVFSRLLEKINRPPSKATNNMVLLNNNSNRDP
ncbi:uncharacterized protein At1g51745 isoform X3 [Benincasa hispida]|uniref:uncharacterized protein At1g51745 isoform X3 n=1 Tax=Benincasa hispida TaxID=102211 RepID=UPI0019015149|nr:uncharacterized protein At1g51745 isoform X3 [Benincasa hispida]